MTCDQSLWQILIAITADIYAVLAVSVSCESKELWNGPKNKIAECNLEPKWLPSLNCREIFDAVQRRRTHNVCPQEQAWPVSYLLPRAAAAPTMVDEQQV